METVENSVDTNFTWLLLCYKCSLYGEYTYCMQCGHVGILAETAQHWWSILFFTVGWCLTLFQHKMGSIIIIIIITRMHGSALCCVRSHYLSLCNNGKFDPCKYKTVKDIEKLFGIYHYVAESSCCAKFYRNRITHFGWANRGSFSFFLLTNTQTDKQINSFISPTGRKYGPNWTH